MSATRPSNQDAASEQLMFVSGYVYRLLHAKARTLGIRWSGLMVLVDLDRLGPTEQRTLVEIEKLRGSTMTVLLQDLERRGWVERETHEGDARVTRVMITASGRTELRRAGLLLREHLNSALSGMSSSVLRDVAAALKPVSAALMQKGLLRLRLRARDRGRGAPLAGGGRERRARHVPHPVNHR